MRENESEKGENKAENLEYSIFKNSNSIFDFILCYILIDLNFCLNFFFFIESNIKCIRN